VSIPVSQAARIKKEGGRVFDTYTLAENYCHAEMYPPEVEGLIPRAPGHFSPKKVNGLRIYIPKPPAFSEALVDAIGQVWQAISPDCGADDNECAIEMCIDRLGGDDHHNEAYARWWALRKRYDYPVLLKALAAHPRLQFV
jgi:hypothetical protein